MSHKCETDMKESHCVYFNVSRSMYILDEDSNKQAADEGHG